LALRRLRIGRQITSTSEQTTEARAINSVYDFCRQEVLSDRSWPFATRSTTLALVDDEYSDEWYYAYRIPSGCLRIDRLEPNSDVSPVKRYPNTITIPLHSAYVESSDASGRLLLTNEEDPILFYTPDITNEALFLPSFCSALAWKIAVEVGGLLNVDDAVLGRADQMYFVEISKAHAKEINIQGNNLTVESSFIDEGY
jgi:hypothetical protein